ncbi:AAA domain containing protein [uncultured Caudovirales phage]|uniref:AAA domain containing protein n=1 Tax=uncultured Caudovirales phage TaxID=2100421 RepID=A0A6J5RTN5_9CAUD|nr:AAA domain containing protein [uncultured Caudovirales phage]
MATQPQTMTSSDFNLEKINTRDLSEHISASIQMEGNIAVFGRRGTGKTEIAKQEIKKSGLHEVYINLSVLERVDLGGYPNIMSAAAQKRFVDFLLPQFYEQMLDGKAGSKGVVALLDEVDKADPSLWAPLLEFTQFRSINGFKLPQLKSVIMTGNLISEGGSRPSLPLLDRAEKYLVEADVTSWLEWAGKSGHIHPSITAYITDHPKDLFGAIDPEDRYADPSPRGWSRASDILYKGEERGWQPSLLNKKVCGCIGKDAGIKYSNYYEHYQQLLPLIEDVYNGKDVSSRYNALEPTKKLVACMITCARLANQLDESKADDPPKSITHVGKFLQKVSYENVLVAVRSQIQIDRLVQFNLDEHPDWEQVLSKINKSVEG